jgi:hypothetical protein
MSNLPILFHELATKLNFLNFDLDTIKYNIEINILF